MKIRDWKNNKKAIQIIKIIVCIMISFFMVSSIAQAGLKSFQSYTDYKYEGTLDNVKTYENVTEITQQFIANGKILSNVELYFTNIKDIQFKLTILDNENETLFSSEYNEREFSEKQWNPVGVNLSNLKKGYSYTLKIQGTDLSNIPFDSSNMYPKVFEICKINGEEKSEIMVLGLQGTHVYWGSGAILGCVHYIMMVLLGGIICYVILKFEQIYEEYRKKKQKGNWLFAIYFSLLMVFSINPLTESQNQISEFKRIIGQGVNDGLDVSKRISNFNCWFICFAFSYVIFYLFANDLKKKCVTSERQKTFEKMNNTVILAVVLLGLRSFSFFLNSENLSNWLEYSDYMLFAIVMIELIYICFNLNKKIAEDCMEAGVICCWMLAFPITIISSVKWCSGKSLMGVQWIVTIIFMLWVILSRSALFQKKDIQMMVKRMTVFFACIPFLISVYIESLAILNQHGIFVGNVKRNFIVLFAGWTAIAIVVTYSLTKKKRSFSNWKQYAYPIIVFGTSCLWCQIPITGVYNADIFESANTSVLISDFFNYGDIPIVQHYGGHMMTSVWEGILYGVLNNDSQGAIISPYGGYVAVLVSVLFFYLIKNLLDEDIAVLMTLMFPFYNVISYWGLGILVCLAVMLFVKKNTYVRAAFVWFAFIWCTLYRLDLGFAFFAACITTLLVYIIKEKNKKACMQLLITFIAWVVIGIITWFVICVIKGINPIERLIEFFKLNMSNQNWAYSSIGNAALPNFTWTYINAD